MKPVLYAAAVVLLVIATARTQFAREEPAGTNQRAGGKAAAPPADGAQPAAAHASAADARHGITLPDQVQWRDTPGLPPGAKVALLEGDPTKEGYFAMRVRLPDGFRIPPHFHPCHERVTVLSGTFHLGTGDSFDKSAARALPAGSYLSMEPGMHHFAWASGETIVQVTTVGPWGITYVNPADDPRKNK